MSKRVVKLSSHGLDDFQRCPRRFYYTTMRKMEPAYTNPAFNRGGVFTKLLESYYNDKAAGEVQPVLSYPDRFIKESTLSSEDKDLLERVFLQYLAHYRKDELIPKVADLPFSFVLFEDDSYLFIYEGTLDLLAYADADAKRCEKHIAVDFKTYSVFNNYYSYNNQALGYCYAMRTDTFLYDYIGFTKTKSAADNFQRIAHKYPKVMLESWLEDTIYWFKRVADEIDFRKSLQCTGKFGICQYHKLCECMTPGMTEGLIKTAYRHNPYSSWSGTKLVQIVGNEVEDGQVETPAFVPAY